MTTDPTQSDDLLQVVLRPAGIDDWSDIRHLHASAFGALASPFLDAKHILAFKSVVYSSAYIETLAETDLWLATHDERIVGSAGWAPADDSGGLARVESVFVSPLFAGLDIGHRLVRHVESRAAAGGFRSFATRAMRGSVGFFEALGYTVTAHGTHALGTSIDFPVVFMRRELSAADISR